MVIFHSYVSLPEGKMGQELPGCHVGTSIPKNHSDPQGTSRLARSQTALVWLSTSSICEASLVVSDVMFPHKLEIRWCSWLSGYFWRLGMGFPQIESDLVIGLKRDELMSLSDLSFNWDLRWNMPCFVSWFDEDWRFPMVSPQYFDCELCKLHM